MLRTRMQWHQERQRLLSENVANSDTPNYRPRDLAPLQFDRATPALASIGLQRTEVCHIASSEATSRSAGRDRVAACGPGARRARRQHDPASAGLVGRF